MAEIDLAREDEVDGKVDAKKNIARQRGGHGAKAARQEECMEESDNISNHQLYRGYRPPRAVVSEDGHEVGEHLPDDGERQGKEWLVEVRDDGEGPPVATVEECDENSAEMNDKDRHDSVPESWNCSPLLGQLEPTGHALNNTNIAN